ncbi:hypothetical protein EGW08_008095 [Elysia chlorotica]|uniref:Uncharacterized protein n=1 Tax=Elysia chlorotica TaxID=188477 RepID=A0A3S0ZRG7_ELYCH|nr:hypothetical protein EGW08_008095 [Elysia chlorotica]
MLPLLSRSSMETHLRMERLQVGPAPKSSFSALFPPSTPLISSSAMQVSSSPEPLSTSLGVLEPLGTSGIPWPSMILARKRRRRLRDRKCQSQVLLSSSEDEDEAEGLSAKRRAASRERLSRRKTTAQESATSVGSGRQRFNTRCTDLALPGLRDTQPTKHAGTFNSHKNAPSQKQLVKKPWDIGLLNMKTSTCSLVPRWRSGISASTPSLAPNSLGSGKETVV